jgi:hypothetical protein
METTEGAATRSKIVDRVLIETWLANTEEGKHLSLDEGKIFTEVAIEHNLNPFSRELHARSTRARKAPIFRCKTGKMHNLCNGISIFPALESENA